MIDPLPPTVPHLVAAAARTWGSRTALVEGEVRWSFADLDRECRTAASAMLASGVGEGDRVAIWASNGRNWIVAAVGAMTTGAAIVPLNTRLKGREAGEMLRRTSAKVLVTCGNFLGTDYPALLAEEDLPALERTVLLDSDWQAFVAEGKGAEDPSIDEALSRLTAAHVSDIMFTSGTTGAPKGVVSTHDRIVPMFADWGRQMGLTSDDRYLIINPFFHSFGFKAGWVAALIAGAPIYPLATFDIPRVIELIERERISFLPGPPTIYQSLLAAKAKRDFDTSSLRGAATGAASVPPELVRRMRSELGLADTVTAYGMTECATITSCRRGDDAALIAESCGRPLPGLELRIADEEGNPVAQGDAGEVQVRGYGVMLGYLDDPQATAEAIDPDGWLSTGDIGWLGPEGYLRITDRKKDMFISGGFNVYPAEVEHLLAEHPAIAQAAVIGVPDERMGEVGKAFVVLRPGQALAEHELAEWARGCMANYKVPRAFAFVESLPHNASGKVTKEALRDA
ncbi:FadD3 family acyl-CoA ligase [Pelagerythrobacter aerophilus]|uniref:3-methylmercaptopropionyl-CoA ligase n=1 Tax=Pelagerythrobacter aerophilus TaxID=2306995 RepID=A0A418NDA2_9SPHN|nr:FadD3 family acyl-CoA ligase [Pelagerythrobacter aerophilus]RIV75489.1 fatty acid--CoA ligase [Pelagerythrobacter aerophilus]